ncbi:hypothetical protein H7Q97_15055 [Ochrobactrum sp. CM-21-5]|nr:hypothetical protein [Ochrobactrum sp. CM-21-5]MBC2886709.1 hypothetical protein [Ochrobactrum sp. CM-21-5]
MRNSKIKRRKRIVEPAVRSGILAAPLIVMLIIVAVLSGAEPKLLAVIDQTITGSITPLLR